MSTATKTFTFNTGQEGWQFATSSISYNWTGSTIQALWLVSGGNPATQTQNSYMYWDGTWENLGVPAGATVNQVQLGSISRQITSMISGGSITQGPVEFYQQGGSLQATLLAGRTGTATDGSFNVSGAGSYFSVPSGLQASSSNIEIRVRTDMSITSMNGGNLTCLYDNIVINVDYTPSTPPTVTGSAVLSIQHPVLREVGTYKYIYNATSRLNTQHPTLVASGLRIIPVYSGKALLSKTKTLTASGIRTAPIYTSSTTKLLAKHPTLSIVSAYITKLNRNTTLFMKGHIPINTPSGLNLSINGVIPGLQSDYTGYGINLRPVMSPSLYIGGVAANKVERTTTLFISAFAQSLNKNLNLFLQQGVGGSQIPLYIEGAGTPGVYNIIKWATLYERGHIKSTNTVPLTIFMDTLTAHNAPLFIKGPIQSTNYTTLYIRAPEEVKSKYLNIFLKAEQAPVTYSNTSLYIYGNNQNLLFSALPLYMLTSQFGNKLNLSIGGTISGNKTSSINLYMDANPPIAYLSSPLFIMNKQESSSLSTDLYIRGLGRNPGYIPSEGKINMLINGFGSGRFASPVSNNNILYLLINGQVVLTGSYEDILSLFMNAPPANYINNNKTLFISGANPPNLNSSIPLVIYKTGLSKTTPLYIHGF